MQNKVGFDFTTPYPRTRTNSPLWGSARNIEIRLATEIYIEQMRVPDWPHYPTNDLPKITPPRSPPTSTE
ncbi:MAG TPA: hypothetical protein VIS96_09465 [Terrimicrobiaceae bacterium]